MKVKDMMSSLRWWGATRMGDKLHIMLDPDNRAECGIYVLPWKREQVLDFDVCERCLKATEKYA